MGTPTPEEQLMLQFMNRARTDPYGEMELLFNTGQSNIDGALSFFAANAGITVADMEATALGQVEGFGARAPLAWNTFLGDSAANHNNLMIDNNTQSHNLPGELGLIARIQDAGYVFAGGGGAGENIFGFTQDPLQGHAGYYIDWGFTSSGIQNPPGHRDSILSTSFRETGIDYAPVDPATLPPAPPNSSDLGPFSNTQHFAVANATGPFLVGVAIDDLDNDDFYDIGEGLGGITVTATGTGGTFSTTTWSSGGYQMEVAAGSTYTVTFSGAGLGVDQSFTVVVGAQSVMLDVEANGTPGATTGGADIITGSIASERIVLKGGDDLANAGGGNDTVIAGGGNDTVTGDGGADKLVGGGGNDSLDGGASDDTLVGSAGDDTLLGGGGNDRTVGGSGDDDISGGVGYDTLVGGGDDDLLSGGLGNDLVLGNTGNDTASGDAGDDRVLGASGNDSLSGGDGDDIVRGGTGTDFIAGDAGFDTLWGDSGDDTIEGGAGDDVVNGGADNDLLRGQAGEDRLSAGDGNDNLFGGDDDDMLLGGGGNDTLDGESGDDTLEGGAGNDDYTGGVGADTFILNNDLAMMGDADVIQDLDFAEDTLVLRNLSGTDFTLNSVEDLYALPFMDLNGLTVRQDNSNTLIEFDDGVQITHTATLIGITDPFMIG